MPMFSLKKVAALAKNRQAYLRGVSLYNAGRVHALTRVDSAFYSEFITAQVTGDDGDVLDVEVGFDGNGDAGWYYCNCGQFREGDGACRHIVGALTDKYYRDMLGGVTPLTAPASVRTGEAVHTLLKRYPAADTAQLRAAENVGDITLTPILALSGLRPFVTFTVGRSRPYIIKDIAQFVQAMRDGDTVSYGKDFAFFHHPSAFTPAAREVLSFLMSEYAETEAIRAVSGRELPLSPGGLDRLLQLFGDQYFFLRLGGETHTVSVHKGDPAISVTVGSVEGGFCFTTTRAVPLAGAQNTYVLCDGALHRCSEDFAVRAKDWLAAAFHSTDGMTVSKEDIAAFCAQVLPTVREVMPINNEDLLADYMPHTPNPIIYLDCPEEGTVAARVVFDYAGKEIPLFADVHKNERRDTRLERAVRVAIERYFTAFRPETGEVVFHGDEDTVYTFLTEGLPALESLATVMATDAFRRLRPIPPPDVSVGVRVDGELLQLDIDVSQWTAAELADLAQRFREQKAYTRLRSGAFVSLDHPTVQGLALLTEELGLTAAELRQGKISLPRYRALQLQSLLANHPTIQFHQDTVFKGLAQSVRDAAKQPAHIPAALDGVLRPYQKEGFRWLKTLDDAGFGGILADDMGLGKTIQIITLLAADDSGLPSLVVCPTSLVLNWESEIHRFAPDLKVLAVLGSAPTREKMLENMGEYHVVVTSYDTLKRDILLYNGAQFRYQILDEAQVIKNQKTQNARAVKTICAKQRFALTGTPIENRLSELWSIFDFLMPGFLHTYNRFKSRFEIPIVRDGNAATLKRLAAIISPFLMRRKKADVLTELPPKTEHVLVAHMEEEQQKLYAACATDLKERIRREIADDTFRQSRFSVLTLLMRLRQICCDPALCTEGYAGGSCKREACLELLRQAKDGGHRVLLFSQFTSMLDLLETDLQREGIRYMVLKGSTPAAQRTRMVNEFNAGKADVFLISLKAGGTGLNLTGADTVIHFDPWWNVAAEQQAADRAHRIGQQNPVQVVRLVVNDSVEQRILALQQKKQNLADAVLSEGVTALSDLTAEELLGLL